MLECVCSFERLAGSAKEKGDRDEGERYPEGPHTREDEDFGVGDVIWCRDVLPHRSPAQEVSQPPWMQPRGK